MISVSKVMKQQESVKRIISNRIKIRTNFIKYTYNYKYRNVLLRKLFIFLSGYFQS